MGRLVGLLGAGNMGSAMASNLLRKGYRLMVCDMDDAAAERLVQLGATRAATPAHLAATPGLEALVSMLPSPKHVREAYLGPQGILTLPPHELHPHLLVDCSTSDPATANELAAAASEALLHPHASESHDGQHNPFTVDAPVSGGVPAAQAGTLTFMCGGSVAAVDAARPLLSCMGRQVIHCGPAGSGQAAKLCNNLVLAVSMAGVAEALALARRCGLDPQLMTSIFNSSSARCWASESYSPAPGVQEGVPSSRGYAGGFASRLMVKDLGLVLAAAEGCGAPVPMAAVARRLYEETAARSNPPGSLDFSSIYEAVYGAGADKRV